LTEYVNELWFHRLVKFVWFMLCIGTKYSVEEYCFRHHKTWK